VPVDVRDAEAFARAVQALEQDSRPVEVLVNNAAETATGWFALDDAATWEEVLATNLLGAASCTRAVVRGMLARGRGAVVNIGSVACQRALPGQSAYATAKGGLEALTRNLAAELAPRGIRVNAVVPGVLDVGMARRMPQELRQRVLDHVPAGRAGTAPEVAAAVLFLASDAARYVVGQCLAVDGGLGL